MPPRIAFQSSLPRSGSTLLSNIVGQNPDFHVTPTSGLLDLLYVARGQFSRGEEFKAQDRGEMERAFIGFCRGGLEGYASALTPKPWLLDKSRGWGVHYAFLNAFYPDPKVVCMLRDPVDILCSMERNYRKASLQDSGLVNHSEMLNTSVEKRLDHWVVSPPVGLAMERLLEIRMRSGVVRRGAGLRMDRASLSDQRAVPCVSEFRMPAAGMASTHRNDGRSRPAPGMTRHHGPVA